MGDAGRVIAGSARGVRLRAPGAGTRPLADRVKQTLFAILEPELEDARVLDLFAGSGAGGIEALSRGAASATFVEKEQGAAAVIRWHVPRWLADCNAEVSFHLSLGDPPYAEAEFLPRVLWILGEPVAPL